MQAENSGQAATQSQSAPRSRPRRPRGSRRGGRGGAANVSESLEFRPASVAPASQTVPSNRSAPSNQTASTPSETPTSEGASRGRARRGGRGRGGARGNQPDRRTADGRQFGGQLTQADSSQASLQAAAAEFVPGQQAGQKQKARAPAPPKQPRQQKRRMSKSQAPDIATRTHEDIDNGHYECPICTSEVQRNSKVWACHTCWTAFHLTCIKKWSTNQGAAVAVPNAQGENPPPRQWRCPGCNLPKDDLPKLHLLVRERSRPEKSHWHSTSFLRTDMRERASQEMPASLSTHLPRRTMPALYAYGSSANMLLRQTRSHETMLGH
jgi:transcriptional repressor NF-X1